jgi:hypothetical protein
LWDFFFNPSNTPPVVPFSESTHIIILSEDSIPVLLSTFPVPFEFTSVRPSKNTIARFFVINVVSDVRTSVWPIEFAFATHFIANPLPLISLSVTPNAFAHALDIVIDEFSLVGGVFGPFKYAEPMLLPFYKLPLV